MEIIPEAEAKSPPQILAPWRQQGAFWRIGVTALVLIWIAAVSIGIRFFNDMSLLGALVVVVLMGAPITASGIYFSAIRQSRRLTMFASHGTLFGILSGRWIRIAAWSFLAAIIGFFTLLELRGYDSMEWWIIGFSVLAFGCISRGTAKALSAELKPYLIPRAAVVVARWITPILATIVYLLAVRYSKTPVEWDSIREAVDAVKTEVGIAAGSSVLAEASQWMVFVKGFKVYALGRVFSADENIALFVLASLKLLVVFNISTLLAFFFIPMKEFRRAFAAPTDADVPGPVTRQMVKTTLVYVLIPIVVVGSFAFWLENWLKTTPGIAKVRSDVEQRLTIAVEALDNEFFRKGTLARIEELRVEHVSRLQRESVQPLEGALDAAFVQIEKNVDIFLDGYYSLWGDATRFAALVTGGLQEHMKAKLEESLQTKQAFEQVNRAFETALKVHKELEQSFNIQVAQVKDRNRVSPLGKHRIVNGVASSPNTQILAKPRELIAFEARLGVSTAGGLGAGVLAYKLTTSVLEKVAGRPVFKLAVEVVEQVLKRSFGKFAGATGGATAGAAIGTFFGPGVGTAIGATVGFIVGIGTGVAIDKLLLEIDEAVNRDKFKEEILRSIREAKADLAQAVFRKSP